jgi:hypothetical protein
MGGFRVKGVHNTLPFHGTQVAELERPAPELQSVSDDARAILFDPDLKCVFAYGSALKTKDRIVSSFARA